LQSAYWIRLLIVIPMLLLFLLAQRYWFMQGWRFAGRIKRPFLRRLARGVIAAAFGLVGVALLLNAFLRQRELLWQYAGVVGIIGLWVTSAFWAYFAVQTVAVAAWLGRQAHRLWSFARSRVQPASLLEREPASASVDFGRRGFLQAATVVAGALPFACGGYGFAIGRRQYQVSEVALPVSGLQPGLEGLRIVQLSDIHIGSYMSASDVRRVVDMANELGADLAVVTGDFVTGASDPLRDCISELSRLRAPLGVWGCNGNHEIYAGAEGVAADLFARHGMHLLRQENVELVRHRQSLNLIGVDYQRPRDAGDRPLAMLDGLEPLLRRDMPNILLSHNPNAFPRAAELGVELTLAGHTHGGQVTVEILDYRVSPARFLTRYIAGPFKRPLGAAAELEDEQAWAAAPARPASLLYVNRGLGTIFAPLRLGVPPEISLFTLRRA
jgi:predicted MPP superfamily phosphohydrolase